MHYPARIVVIVSCLVLITLFSVLGLDLPTYVTTHPPAAFAAQQRQTQCVAPPLNLVAWYPFDDATGTTEVDIVGGHNGTRLNGPTSSTGRVGNALSLGGADYVSIPDTPTLNYGTGDFSINMWIKTTGSYFFPVDKRDYSLSGGYALVIWDGYLLFQMDNNGNFTNYSVSSGAALSDDQWHLVAVTVARNDPIAGVKLYVDGAFIGSFAPRLGNIDNQESLSVGQHHPNVGGSVSGVYPGSIDELRFFNRALHADEIQGMYQADQQGTLCKNGPFPTPVPTPTPTAQVINSSLVQSGYTQSCTHTADATYPVQSAQGVCTLTFTLSNTSGQPLFVSHYQINRITNNNWVLNATPTPGQVGAQVVVTQTIATGSTLNPLFRIGLLSWASYGLRFNVYGYPSAMTAAQASQPQAVLLGEFEANFIPQVDPKLQQLFLPLVKQ